MAVLSYVIASGFLHCFLALSTGVSAGKDYPVDLSTTQRASSCSDTLSSLQMMCPYGHMVQPVRVFYGQSTSDGCYEKPSDCTLDVPETEHYLCTGHRICVINLQRRWIPKCNAMSTYIQAHYLCIQSSSVVNVCESRLFEAQSGYLSTPNYPDPYPASRHCNITIRAPYKSQNLRLWIIDLNLEINVSDCADSLYINDGYRANTLCNSRSRALLMTSQENTIDISFYSNPQNQERGFWLYFEAFPFVPPTTTTTTTSLPTTSTSTWSRTTTTAKKKTTTSVEQTTTVAVMTPDNTESSPQISHFSLVVLLGVLFAVTLCTLALVFLYIVVRRRRYQSKSAVPASSYLVSSSSADFLTQSSACSTPNQPPDDCNFPHSSPTMDATQPPDKYYKHHDLQLTIANTCYNNSHCEPRIDHIYRPPRGEESSIRHAEFDLNNAKKACKPPPHKTSSFDYMPRTDVPSNTSKLHSTCIVNQV